MSAPPDQLDEVADALFSRGMRSDGDPRRPGESPFDFLDRVRQPYFEREREWYEDAFSSYPSGADRGDLRARFRRGDDLQHGAAAWELHVHEMWRRLGWTLSPHPETLDGRRLDFLAERDGEQFLLECAVDGASLQQAGAERRWEKVWTTFKALDCPTHRVMIDRTAIGSNALRAGPLFAEAQRNLNDLAADQHSVVLQVATEDGWRFSVEASPGPLAGVVSYVSGGGMSMETRLYNPIRNRVKDKSKHSRELELPLVLALQVISRLPIVTKDGSVRGALMGTQTQMLGHVLEPRGVRANDDGLWVRGGEPRGRGLSALLLLEGDVLGDGLPVLHHHPDPLRPFEAIDLPFEQVRYEVTDIEVEHHTEATAGWRDLFGLPAEWPGPENSFEGINTVGPRPPPEFWSPVGLGDKTTI
jgi:hypothetical protein